MPRAYSLTRADFILKAPIKRFHGVFFSLVTSSANEGVSKFACVVSKKVALRANVRNLIKRRCRAVFRDHMIGLQDHRIYIFTAKKSAVTASFPEMRADIQKLVAVAKK